MRIFLPTPLGANSCVCSVVACLHVISMSCNNNEHVYVCESDNLNN